MQSPSLIGREASPREKSTRSCSHENVCFFLWGKDCDSNPIREGFYLASARERKKGTFFRLHLMLA